jgi:signal peptidase I
MRKRRRPLVAAALSLVLPGLGQLYNGQVVKAVVFFGIGAALWAVMSLTPLMASVSGLVAAVSSAAALSIVAVFEAALAARRLGVIELRRFTRAYVHALVYLSSLALSTGADLVARAFVGRYESFSTPAGSMMPTLEIGDVFFAGAPGLTGAPLRRGEVIVFQYPIDPDKDFVKRVVGLAGDVIEVREGHLVVNGRPVERCDLGEYRYSERDGLTGEDTVVTGQLRLEHLDGRIYRVLDTGMGETCDPERVPPGHVFVLGDNRDNSHDSRRWGGVPHENIRGRALFGLYSRPPAGGLSLARAGDSLDDLDTVLHNYAEQVRRCRAAGFPI